MSEIRDSKNNHTRKKTECCKLEEHLDYFTSGNVLRFVHRYFNFNGLNRKRQPKKLKNEFRIVNLTKKSSNMTRKSLIDLTIDKKITSPVGEVILIASASTPIKQEPVTLRVTSPSCTGSNFIGVAGFELATSASLRRRSNQAEPHPVFQQLDNNIIANR